MLKVCCRQKLMVVLDLFPKLTLTDDKSSHSNAKKQWNKIIKVCIGYMYQN